MPCSYVNNESSGCWKLCLNEKVPSFLAGRVGVRSEKTWVGWGCWGAAVQHGAASELQINDISTAPWQLQTLAKLDWLNEFRIIP